MNVADKATLAAISARSVALWINWAFAKARCDDESATAIKKEIDMWSETAEEIKKSDDIDWGEPYG